MATFHVFVQRTEEITFSVEADSQEDAESRYLSDGDEIFSTAVSTSVTDVEEV